MKINLEMQKNQQFSPLYIFFIIMSMMVGVELVGTPRVIFEEAGHDAWISIILAYLFIFLLLLIMLFILRQYENTDILGVQTDLFGNFISKLIGTVYLIYFLSQLLAALATYIDIVKVFVFPDLSPFILNLMLLVLAVYAVLGGLRTIIGVCVLFMFFSYWLSLLLIEPIRQMEIFHFLPVMDKGFADIMKGTAAAAYTFTGFEILFFIYPFVQNKNKIGKPLFFGFSVFAFLTLATTIITIGFLSPDQLERRIWPVLNLYKIQTTPIIERLDYVVVAEWMMVLTPQIILTLWCIHYILKRVYNLPKKISVYSTAALMICCLPFFTEHFKIQMLIESSKYLAIGLVYIYPLILLPLVIVKKIFRKKGKNTDAKS